MTSQEVKALVEARDYLDSAPVPTEGRILRCTKGDAIKILRLSLKLSQQSFAERVGVGIATISRLELGKTKVSRKVRLKLEEFAKKGGR